MTVNPWETSNREALLTALEHVIRTEIPELGTVRRQALDKEGVAEGALPAILIDEASSSYKFDHRFIGEMDLKCIVTFDLQARARKTKGQPLGNLSQAREAMIARLLQVLQNNPTLTCQLPGEDEPMDHAKDVFPAAEVRYVKTTWPDVRALVTILLKTSENFLEKPQTQWRRIILSARPLTEDDEDTTPLTTTVELDPS